jgi:hypothetical protein
MKALTILKRACIMNKVISFCLYGDDKVYYDGCLANASLVYPGWICRFYVSQHVSNSFVDKLEKLGAEVVRKESKGEHDGSLWRFLPVSDPDVDIMISRDVDARLGDRDMFVIDEWLNSGKTVHVIRDHPSHVWPILAGLWGYRGTLPSFNIDKVSDFTFGTDQKFLAKFYNEVKGDLFVHSDYVMYPNEEVHQIAMDRGGDVWLGMPHGRCPERIEAFRSRKHRPLMMTTKGLI